MSISSITSTKLTGLASGMDTDALVDSLMQIEQLKLNRELRAQTTLQWKQEALTGVDDSLTEFKQTYMSVLSASNMYTSSVYNVFDVAVSGNSGNAVTIKAGAAASAGSYQIDQVMNLAQSSKAVSSQGLSGSGQLSEANSAKLSTLDFKNALSFEDGKISFSINGETFEFSETDTLQKMINTVNANEKAGVTMNYSRLTDKITFSTKETGANTEIKIENLKGNAFGAGGAFGIEAGDYKNGEDALVKIEGIEVTRASNTFSIDGITYTLNKETAADEPISFTLTQNIDGTVDKVKAFVEAYNALVSKLDTLLSETKSSSEKSYTPLTEEEKADMTEEQIATWETIAKKGILRSDSGISSMLNNLRGALYATVDGVGLSPSQIGIKTGSWYNKGQITLDEDALRAAIQKDPQQVMDIFTSSSDSQVASTAYSENGLLNRISNIMTQYSDSQELSLDTIGDSISDLSDKIDTMTDKMSDLEEKYYQKFALMETALSKLQAQSDSLSSLLGSAQ